MRSLKTPKKINCDAFSLQMLEYSLRIKRIIILYELFGGKNDSLVIFCKSEVKT